MGKQSQLLLKPTEVELGLQVGVEFDKITSLIIKFENEAHGQMWRESNPGLASRYPGGTEVKKVCFPFSLSKSKKGVIATAKVIQFPIKLAFAATSHKIQGQNVKKPRTSWD